MTWTAKLARYQTETMTVGREPFRITKHYVLTRHGLVARAFMPAPLYVTVALLRRNRVHPQYQGTITHDGECYVATTPEGADGTPGEETARTANYIDAEAALLVLKTKTRSHMEWHFPRALREELNCTALKPTCPTCGWETVNDVCVRPELHWTAASIAANARREERARPA